MAICYSLSAICRLPLTFNHPDDNWSIVSRSLESAVQELTHTALLYFLTPFRELVEVVAT